ncbi:MAG TPA: ADP-glyceromanno-heptose 6-epimerase [Burkholderiaceae bacterium]|nr:ADP-glyceromanno-heptose 6-epimerase [Burkholderiaceae bacterium]
MTSSNHSRCIVTGAAGFIGANIIKGLNARGINNIIAVDDLTQGDKFRNIADLQITDYVDASDFYDKFTNKSYGQIDAVFHEGACSDTMEHNGKFMMDNNFRMSCDLFAACQSQKTRLLYASSAATYGGSTVFKEVPQYELPLNVYGYSKLLFDQKLRFELGSKFEKAQSQVAGFRYFNVYGPREQHKGRMASVAFHQFHQFKKDGKVKLFGGYGGYAAGMQERDFIYIDDVVSVNLWFYDHPEISGIFNIGAGRAQPFNDVALAVINTMRSLNDSNSASLTLQQAVDQQFLEYTEFPEALVGKYQCHTLANIELLRHAGYKPSFMTVQEGVADYIRQLSVS